MICALDKLSPISVVTTTGGAIFSCGVSSSPVKSSGVIVVSISTLSASSCASASGSLPPGISVLIEINLGFGFVSFGLVTITTPSVVCVSPFC
jgi:hypothetical protein